MGRYQRESFVPVEHEQALIAIVRDLERLEGLDDRAFTKLLHRHPKGGGESFSKSELIQGVRAYAQGLGLDSDALVEKLKRKPIRTQSGVAPVTVLTKPFPCPGRCVFCPSDVRMPKSYLSMEPGAQRAAQHRFDPYAQTRARLIAYLTNGHPIDKIELIILGGTFTAYTVEYQRWFVKRMFDALNEIEPDASLTPPDPRQPEFANIGRVVDGRDPSPNYNSVVGDFLRDGDTSFETATAEELRAAHVINEHALARSVGLVIETRPDELDLERVMFLRSLGVTKVQLGYQSLDDDVLTKNQRGHDVAASREATKRLRRAGFKIHAHFMPNLLGSTPELDKKGFTQLFADPDFKPDELKLYPCMLIESAELMRHYETKAWQPYDDATLLELLSATMAEVPRWCRLTRVIRDIPSHDIVAGNKQGNLREHAEAELDRRHTPRKDIRSREIRGRAVDPATLRFVDTRYATSAGEERFLELVTEDDHIAAFLRLTLPSAAAEIAELDGRALIRELHVYGVLAPLGAHDPRRAQHLGLGKQLIEKATAITKEAGYPALSVISAVGTRAYYRALGFTDGALYQELKISPATPVERR